MQMPMKISIGKYIVMQSHQGQMYSYTQNGLKGWTATTSNDLWSEM